MCLFCVCDARCDMYNACIESHAITVEATKTGAIKLVCRVMLSPDEGNEACKKGSSGSQDGEPHVAAPVAIQHELGLILHGLQPDAMLLEDCYLDLQALLRHLLFEGCWGLGQPLHNQPVPVSVVAHVHCSKAATMTRRPHSADHTKLVGGLGQPLHLQSNRCNESSCTFISACVLSGQQENIFVITVI